MVKGLLVGLGIMLVCLLIPIAHFVLVPASPFIAGYWGISFTRTGQRHYAIEGLVYGVLLGLLVGLIAAAAALPLTALELLDRRFEVLLWIGVVVLTLYTGSMSTMGAMYSSLREQQRAEREAAAGFNTVSGTVSGAEASPEPDSSNPAG